MHRLTRSAAAIALLVLALAMTACSGGAKSDPATTTSDEAPVPEGMPVMYEFFTDT